ncbi:MAG: Fe-S cluster assembly protein SufD [Alphaproteobacteria bacterium]|nr:Fe-S cluster assembly protein SufD [Alphaproteobacteria bacterium]
MASSRASLHPPRSAEEQALIERYAHLPADASRRAAIEAFEKTGLPHRRVEGWRWSDVRAAVRGLECKTVAEPPDPFHSQAEGSLYFYDDGLPSRGRIAAGVKIDELAIGAGSGDVAAMPLAALTAALASGPAVTSLDISSDTVEPIRLHFDSRCDGQFRRVEITLRKGVTARVLESHVAGAGFSSVLVDYRLEADATLHRVVYQAGADTAVQAANARVWLGHGARLVQTALGFGAKLARIETRVTHGAGASEAILNGAYLAGKGRHVDFTSHVGHDMPGCVTRQIVKGAARAGGRGVFQGKFLVARDAQKTDANMEHHALLLEDGAEVNAKPELEIYADDVQCAHGNTAGAIDEDALFYIRQRGVPEREARAMLTESFINEAFGAADPAIADILTAEARQWLLAPQ